MNNGWYEVARLGLFPRDYPHVLVDKHGWCLRLGPEEDKYYSSMPTLLQGLIEHLLRRRLREAGPLLCAQSMLAAVRAALEEAGRLPMPNQSPIQPPGMSKAPPTGPDLFPSRDVA
jgi:hypothetical protein